ncbi:glycosyltransferase family 1 protein [Priestia aryabhattai]|uniref:glycosyltransferase family 4 protein n=1 Tax=Priestia aryabhattai TaxID=412384 RepID=UPI00048CB534|nr:glycosyltransferase family 1 protein [Priestia aryabhattai]MED3920224.1 glycosyltransferase family 1 protein [Priestia aryabhattai]
MNILIDGYYLDKKRGMGRYLQEVLYALNYQINDSFNVSLIVPEKLDPIYEEKFNNINFIRARKIPHPMWEQYTIPSFFKKGQYDLLHSPYNTTTLSINPEKVVVTIHDTMFLDKKHKNSGVYQWIGNKYRSFITKRISPKATVITVSKESQISIKDKLNLNSKSYHTPVDFFYDSVSSNLSESSSAFIYHIGGLSSHKNTERVINAFNDIKDIIKEDLIISGMPSGTALEKKYSNPRIKFTGWISEYEMGSLYNNAELIVFPSLYEGYGLPVIEAIRFGKPLITSDINPMKEISRGAAILINPKSTEELKKSILKVLSNDDVKDALVKKTREVREKVNSREFGVELINMYRGQVK